MTATAATLKDMRKLPCLGLLPLAGVLACGSGEGGTSATVGQETTRTTSGSGGSGTSSATTTSSGTGDTSSSASDGTNTSADSTSDGSIFDVGSVADIGIPLCPSECDAVSPGGGGSSTDPWLLHNSNGKLWRVSTVSGEGVELCTMDPEESYTSLTFTPRQSPGGDCRYLVVGD